MGSFEIIHKDKEGKVLFEHFSERKILKTGGAEVTKKSRKLNKSSNKLSAWKKLTVRK